MSDKTIYTFNSFKIPEFLRKYFSKKTDRITIRFSSTLYNELLLLYPKKTIQQIVEELFLKNNDFILYAFETHMLTSFSSMVNYLAISKYQQHLYNNVKND